MSGVRLLIMRATDPKDWAPNSAGLDAALRLSLFEIILTVPRACSARLQVMRGIQVILTPAELCPRPFSDDGASLPHSER